MYFFKSFSDIITRMLFLHLVQVSVKLISYVTSSQEGHTTQVCVMTSDLSFLHRKTEIKTVKPNHKKPNTRGRFFFCMIGLIFHTCFILHSFQNRKGMFMFKILNTREMIHTLTSKWRNIVTSSLHSHWHFLRVVCVGGDMWGLMIYRSWDERN